MSNQKKLYKVENNETKEIQFCVATDVDQVNEFVAVELIESIHALKGLALEVVREDVDAGNIEIVDLGVGLEDDIHSGLFAWQGV